MSITHNSSWLLIQPYVKEDDSIITVEQMKNIWINQRKSKLLDWEFKAKPIRAYFGQFRNQSYKIFKVEHEPQFIKAISVKYSILWSADILYSQNIIFLFYSFKLHFYWRCLVTMPFYSKYLNFLWLGWTAVPPKDSAQLISNTPVGAEYHSLKAFKVSFFSCWLCRPPQN